MSNFVRVMVSMEMEMVEECLLMVVVEECLLLVVEELCLWWLVATSSQDVRTCSVSHLLVRRQWFGCGCNIGMCHHELQVSSMGRGCRLVD